MMLRWRATFATDRPTVQIWLEHPDLPRDRFEAEVDKLIELNQVTWLGRHWTGVVVTEFGCFAWSQKLERSIGPEHPDCYLGSSSCVLHKQPPDTICGSGGDSASGACQ